MPAAYCINCGKIHHWRNQRGNKLSYMTSPCCKDGLKRAVGEIDEEGKFYYKIGKTKENANVKVYKSSI